jgi:hypothetical protein
MASCLHCNDGALALEENFSNLIALLDCSSVHHKSSQLDFKLKKKRTLENVTT